MKVNEGKLEAKGFKFGLVASRFNEFITNKLVDGARDALVRLGASEDDITLHLVPGALEIPIVVGNIVDKYDAVIALGTVIRGETPHFEYVAAESAKGLAQISLESKKPVINAILTTDNIEQAVDRAGAKSGNKGFNAAQSAVEMVNLLKNI